MTKIACRVAALLLQPPLSRTAMIGILHPSYSPQPDDEALINSFYLDSLFSRTNEERTLKDKKR